jgi:hypothetical protein
MHSPPWLDSVALVAKAKWPLIETHEHKPPKPSICLLMALWGALGWSIAVRGLGISAGEKALNPWRRRDTSNLAS